MFLYGFVNRLKLSQTIVNSGDPSINNGVTKLVRDPKSIEM